MSCFAVALCDPILQPHIVADNNLNRLTHENTPLKKTIQTPGALEQRARPGANFLQSGSCGNVDGLA
jgi:hypothetical protein